VREPWKKNTRLNRSELSDYCLLEDQWKIVITYDETLLLVVLIICFSINNFLSMKQMKISLYRQLMIKS